jgi:D-alanyl-D-alanine carboxypeptidase (penicillin-binding protein 5/6)
LDLALAIALVAAAVWAAAPLPAHTQPGPPPESPQSASAIAGCRPHPASFGAVPPLLQLTKGSAAPHVSASSVAVMDAASGRVLYGRNMHERRAPASTTKIMTALLSVEAISDDNGVVVSSTDATAMIGSSVMGLWPSAEVTLRDLLFGLMLPSGNDAAVELARNLAPSEAEFVRVMNERAAVMHLRNTQFTNPHGLDEWGHYSSAYDMARLSRYAMQNERFRAIAGTQQYHLGAPLDYDVYNGNSLLGAYPGAEGVKIGWTEAAGWTFVASANRDGREVIVSLMNSADRDADAAALLDWAFASPHWQGAVWSPPQAPSQFHRLAPGALTATPPMCEAAPAVRR